MSNSRIEIQNDINEIEDRVKRVFSMPVQYVQLHKVTTEYDIYICP